MELLATIIITASAVGYITQYLLLVKKHSHFGFLPSKSKIVVFPERRIDGDGFVATIPEHHQPVVPIDYLRRLFGAYKVQDDRWEVRSYADVWTCAFCLSFWTSFAGTFVIWQIYKPEWWMLILSHLATAFIAQRLVEINTMDGIPYESN